MTTPAHWPYGPSTQQVERHWIPTYTGKLIDLAAPAAVLIDPIDIAVSLARKPRWNGQTVVAYTVADHTLAASYLVADEHRLAALLHDAAEAYLGDVARPLKILLGATWRRIEERFDRVVAERFRLIYPWSRAVTAVDDRLLAAERASLIDPAAAYDSRWCPFARVEHVALVPAKPRCVLRAWLERYVELTGETVDFSELPPSRPEWRRQREQRGGGA